MTFVFSWIKTKGVNAVQRRVIRRELTVAESCVFWCRIE